MLVTTPCFFHCVCPTPVNIECRDQDQQQDQPACCHDCFWWGGLHLLLIYQFNMSLYKMCQGRDTLYNRNIPNISTNTNSNFFLMFSETFAFLYLDTTHFWKLSMSFKFTWLKKYQDSFNKFKPGNRISKIEFPSSKNCQIYLLEANPGLLTKTEQTFLRSVGPSVRVLYLTRETWMSRWQCQPQAGSTFHEYTHPWPTHFISMPCKINLEFASFQERNWFSQFF